MSVSLKEVMPRVYENQRTGASLDTIARKLNAEFQMCAYVVKSKLWASFKDETGVQRTRVLVGGF